MAASLERSLRVPLNLPNVLLLVVVTGIVDAARQFRGVSAPIWLRHTGKSTMR
jgi:hypothetical protein